MPMDARDIETMIKAAIPDADVTIRDLAGDGDHYAATVISESFRGKSRVQQHQIVYQSLRGQMGGVLHALALQTGVPEAQLVRSDLSCRARTSVGSRQHMNRKHVVLVGPGIAHRPTRAARQRRETFKAVFVAALSMDALAGAK